MKPTIEKLKTDLVAGRITRREFMAGATALGVSAAMVPTLARQAYAATPQAGGHFRMGMAHGSTTDSLDPASYENGFMTNTGYAIQNHLVEVDANGNAIPELAESMEANDGATEWRFELRKDVEFHNGKTLAPSDIIASFQHHMGESESPANSLLSDVESIEADGNAVVFKLAAGNADFPYITSDYHIAIKPAVDGKIDPTDGIGTGAFMMESFEAGVRFSGVKNTNYFKEGRGHFDSLEILSIVDTTARTNALTTGEIDAMDRADLKTVHLLERNSDINVLETVGFLHYTFPMRTDTDPYTNHHLRLALKYAVNRDELVQKVLRGHGVVGNDHPISPALKYHAADLEQHTYDPDKAKFHLKEAGYDSIDLDLSAADAAFPGAVDAAVLYQQSAVAAGININVIREPNDGYWSNVWMNKPWCACYWGGRPTEDWMFSTAYVEDASWNDTFWKHDRFNELHQMARVELDEAKRREMYTEMQQIVSNDGGVVVPMFANYVFGTSTKVMTPEKLAGNWELDGMKAHERWWYAS